MISANKHSPYCVQHTLNHYDTVALLGFRWDSKNASCVCRTTRYVKLHSIKICDAKFDFLVHCLGLQLIPVTYVVFPTTTYNNADSEQHTNCSTTTMNSHKLLLCGGRSALSDDIKGNINTKDGLQKNELQKFFIWNASDLDTVPFVSIVFKERTMPHSVDLYFHSSKTLNIDAPKITLYWSNKSPLDSENVLPFQRMAYFVGNGMYKYKVILDTNDTAPFNYLKIKMELTGNWIFLSEIKVYAEKTEGIGIVKYVD